MIKWILVALYLGSILYVHFRGKVRLKFWRQMFDHSAVVYARVDRFDRRAIESFGFFRDEKSVKIMPEIRKFIRLHQKFSNNL